MKLIISAVALTTLAQSSRLLQQIDACSTVRCGADGRTECYVNPVNTDIAVCCAPDEVCSDEDYQSTDVAICMEDGGLQKYDNKCLGRCDGNQACGQLCTCDTDADCATGYSCLETPFGFGGCDENVGNSCYGFCTTERQGACGGFVGPAGCTAEEACFLYSTESNSLGSCYSLPDTCDVTPAPTCGGGDNCLLYSTGCSTCLCNADGTETCTRNPNLCQTDPLSGEIICNPCDPLRGPYPCDVCQDGFTSNGLTGECTPIQTCAAVTCGPGLKCIFDPANGGRCVDENVCCPPLDEVLAENPFACFEGCACCPDGTWQGSIGDGDTFCGGLKVSEGDIFGEECSTSSDTVECQTKRDCDSGYKCKKDPICYIDSSINCGDVGKICANYRRNNGCSSDYDCDTNNGEICLLAGSVGICVDIQSP